METRPNSVTEDKTSLKYHLLQIPDPRDSRGIRHKLEDVLELIIIGILSGVNSFEAMDIYLERYEQELLAYLQPKRGALGSHDTMKRMIRQIDPEDLSKALSDWILHKYGGSLESSVLLLDGKALRSTVSQYDSSQQAFQALVNVFEPVRNLVLAQKGYNNKEVWEQDVVYAVIEHLGAKNCILRMDALHCKKNTPPHHPAG